MWSLILRFKAGQKFSNNANASSYYTRRFADTNQLWHSTLEDTPVLLRKYKSEYQFVFEQLHVLNSFALLWQNAGQPSFYSNSQKTHQFFKFMLLHH